MDSHPVQTNHQTPTGGCHHVLKILMMTRCHHQTFRLVTTHKGRHHRAFRLAVRHHGFHQMILLLLSTKYLISIIPLCPPSRMIPRISKGNHQTFRLVRLELVP